MYVCRRLVSSVDLCPRNQPFLYRSQSLYREYFVLVDVFHTHKNSFNYYNTAAVLSVDWISEQVGNPYERLQSQGHVKMAYRCSKFNTYCSLIWRKPNTSLNFFRQNTQEVKKIRMHIFDDGVAAAELLKKREPKKELDWDLNLCRLCRTWNTNHYAMEDSRPTPTQLRL